MTDSYNDEDFQDDRAWIERTAWQMARSVCGRRWRQYVEDAAAEAVIGAWRAAKDGKPRPVQAVAARRSALGYLKKLCGEKFQRAALIGTVSIEDAEFYAEMACEDTALADVESGDAFETLLGHIACDRAKRVLRLRMQDGLTQEEIGERMGMSQPVVSRVLAEALAQLKTVVEASPELAALYGCPTA